MADNPHAGHRERMKRKYLEHGIETLEPHEMVEILLYYAIPQKDTNPIAHRLIKTFGTVSGILNAPPDALTQIEGVTSSAAAYLRLIGDVHRHCERESTPPGTVLNTTRALRNYLWPYFEGMREESVYAVTLNVLCEAIGAHKIASGMPTLTQVGIRRVVGCAIADGAAAIVLSHNHPSGIALPSKEDVAVTGLLAKALFPLDMSLRDHLIFTPGGECLSFRDSPSLCPSLRGE